MRLADSLPYSIQRCHAIVLLALRVLQQQTRRLQDARFPIVLLTGYLEALSHEDRVLFARCLDKGMPIRRLLDTIAEFLDPNQGPDYAP
jgi:hypothetical protein